MAVCIIPNFRQKSMKKGQKVLYKDINSAVLQAAENRNWVDGLDNLGYFWGRN